MKNQTTTNFLGALGFLAALLMAFAQTATAQETALDYTFGTNGRVITNANTFAGISSVAVQPDGKIVAVGRSSHFAVARYLPNGALDGTFGDNGTRVLDTIANPQTGAPLVRSFATTVLIQPDGKIVLTGLGEASFGSPRFFIAARLNPNGAYDTSFNANGRVVTRVPNVGTSLSIKSAAVLQSDGKIVIVSDGVNNTNRNIFSLIRYNSDGTIDTSYGVNGFATARFSPEFNADSVPYSLILQPDGKIIAAGFATLVSQVNNQAGAMARFNINGTLDSTFGTNGLAIDALSPTIYETALQADGKIVAVSPRASGFGGFSLTRYNANGSVDQTFGEEGRIRTLFGNAFSTSSEVLVQPDGKILVGGKVFQPTIGFALARYNPDGSLDRTFGTGGRVIVANAPVDSLEDPDDYDIALQPDGKILFGGGKISFYLVRLKARNSATEFDFDGDARADTSVFRNGTWFINPSNASNTNGFYGVPFGLASDKLTPADYDGDGKTDIAVWREGSFAYFYILNSTNNTVRTEQFGRTGDDPRAVGDWDGDGRADPAVYRNGTAAGAQSIFYYRPSSQPGIDFVGLNWGVSGDEAVRGDFDGDGKIDAAVFRASNQTWFIRQSSNGQLRAANWGLATDKRVAGDFDGDRRTDLAIFRDGLWAILQSSNNQQRYEQFGQTGDRLAAGDYDGDGKTDLAVFRDGVFYVKQSGNASQSAQLFGAAGDTPIASAFAQ